MEVILQTIAGYLQGMAAANPKLVAALALAYLIGLGLKLFREAVEKFVLESPSKDDDAVLAKVEASPVAKVVFFIMDLLIRFKKPGA